MEKLGKYQILERVGQGGMGVVYRAIDPLIERVVAVKTISTHLDLQPELRARFFREGRSAGQLSHKNIITIYDLGEEHGVAYMAMEFLEGENLDAKIANNIFMPLGAKVQIMIEICEGLAHAHSKNVIHRDIKPANVFITRSGQVKILDFGLARIASSDITQSGMAMGTPNYMSPEQVRGEKIDHRADIFSFGVLSYELLTCRKPFQGDSFASTIFKILEADPEPMEHFDASIPPELSSIVSKSLTKDREQRYQQVEDLRRDLLAFRSSPAGAYSRGEQPTMPDLGIVRNQTTLIIPPRPPEAQNEKTREIALTSLAPGEERDQQTSPADRGARPLPPASRKTRAAVISAAGMIALGVVIWVLWHRPTQNPPSAQQPVQVQMPAPAAPTPRPSAPTPSAPASEATSRIEDHLTRAAEALDGHRYADAQAEAQLVLNSSPENARAAQIQRRAKQSAEKISSGNERARSLYQEGKYEEAARAVSDVLRISPSDEDARKIAAQLNQYAQKTADQARAQMRDARSKAEQARAAYLAPDLIEASKRRESEAERFYKNGQFGIATAKFLEVIGSYHEAETQARSKAAEIAEKAKNSEQERLRTLQQGQSEAARASFERERAKAIDAGAETKASGRLREGGRLASEAQAKFERGDFDGARRDFEAATGVVQQAHNAAVEATQAEASRPAPEVSKKAPPTLARSQPDIPSPAETAQVARRGVSAVLEQYKTALENKDLSLLKSIWPGLGGAQERAIRDEFNIARSLHVDFSNVDIQLSGDTAIVTGRRSYQLQTVDDRKLQTQTRTTLSLRRSGGSWIVETIRFEPVR